MPDASPPFSLTETLANLPILWILVLVAVLTALRLALIRKPSPAARAVAELAETGLIAVALVFLLLRPFVMQAFYIPSASMEPTLQGNSRAKDRILVSKLQYRLHPPQRGDVVVFLAPPAAMPGDPPFVKRLIGLPGDRIEAVAGYVLAGRKRYGHADLRAALGAAGEFGPQAQADGSADQAFHHARFVRSGVLADTRLIGGPRLAEILTGMADAPVTVHPGYNIRNGVRLDEPFIAEDPDYDMKIYHGEPVKHEHDPSQAEYKWDGQPITAAEFRKDFAPPTEPLAHAALPDDGRQPQRQQRRHELGSSRRLARRRPGLRRLLAALGHGSGPLTLPLGDLWQYETRARAAGYRLIAGLDEVGRGPLAGPVVAACVVLPDGFALDGINDSKKLTERQRERAEARIRAEAVALGLGVVEPEMIDRINILQASRQAMREAFLFALAPPHPTAP